jgi:hypothetical protein
MAEVVRMMTAHGTLTIGKELPLGTVASDGTFVLTLLAKDEISQSQVIWWRLVWCGLNAKLFYVINKADLLPGTQIDITALRVWPLGNTRFSRSEIHATVTHMRMALTFNDIERQPLPTVREQLLKTEQSEPV